MRRPGPVLLARGDTNGTRHTGAAEAAQAERSAESFGAELRAVGYGPITTEIAEAGPFYFAEGYHQQYLAKNPNGYCGLGGTGVSCPIGVATGE